MSLIIANWKMNGSLALCAEFAHKLQPLLTTTAQVVVCPPSIYLHVFKDSNILLGAQNVNQHETGAFTGEISISMLKECQVKYVIVGHSERRQLFNETDELVCQKIQAIQRHGLTPVVCVGETAEHFAAQKSFAVIGSQLDAFINVVDLNNLVIAYEPIWAIGTGLTATPETAQAMHEFIRSKLNNKITKIIYGGSVKADNAQSLFAQAAIDGALVGGASLDVASFAKICNAFIK